MSFKGICLLFTREKMEQYPTAEGEAAIDVERERRLNTFRPTFEILVSLVSSKKDFHFSNLTIV
jgi:hypothetical protein